MVIAVLVGLAAGTYMLKAAVPLVLGNRALPPNVTRLADLLPAALLAGLVVISTFSEEQELMVDARAAGLLAAAAALALKAPFFVVVLVAAAATAGVRLL